MKLINLGNYPTYIKKYLIVTFTFSYLLWFLSFILAGNEELLLGHHILEYKGNQTTLIASITAMIAGLGPLVGYLFVRKNSNQIKQIKLTRFGSALSSFLLFAVTSLLISSLGFFDLNLVNADLVKLIFILFFFTFISASEELGWRGVLYPYIAKKASTFNQSVLATAIIWGFWHAPVIIVMFLHQGFNLLQIIPMYLLFTASLYLQSYLHAFVNIRSKSILPNILLHGLLSFWVFFLGFLLIKSALEVIIILSYIITVLILDRLSPRESSL